MSLLYTKNRENDLVNMIAAEVSDNSSLISQTSELFYLTLVQVHVGTQNVSEQMKSYVFKRNKEGVHYLDLAKTWEKLMVAARVIAAAQAKNPKDVLVS